MTRTQRAIFVDFRTEIGRSQNSHFFLCEHCKKAPHHPKWPCVLNLSRASCMFGHVDVKWVTFMCAGGSSSEKSMLAWQSSCADTSPKWEVSTPCPKTKRTREVAILKRENGIFKVFPRQPVTCYSQCNRACCEHRLPETSRRTLDVPQRNRVTMQARSGNFDEAPWQMTPIRAASVCSKASDIIAEDAFSVVSQHSSALFLRSAGSAWQELEGRYSWISELRLEDLNRVTLDFWTLQEDPTSHTVTLCSSFLHVWPDCRQVSYFHVCRGQIHQSQLVPVRSLRLLDRVLVRIHLLNGKSPRHARKRKETDKLPY